MTTPYIGSKISLVSKSEIRYEGILYTIDPKEQTIALAKVRCYGTESRVSASSVDPLPVPPREEVYEYIIFKASDIKDLVVCETPQPAPNIYASAGLPQDPAILSSSKETSSTGHLNPQHQHEDSVSNIESPEQQVRVHLASSKTENTSSQTNKKKHAAGSAQEWLFAVDTRRQSTVKGSSAKTAEAAPKNNENKAHGDSRQRKQNAGDENESSKKTDSERQTKSNRRQRDRGGNDNQSQRDRETSGEGYTRRRRRSSTSNHMNGGEHRSYNNRSSPNGRRQRFANNYHQHRFYDDEAAAHFGAAAFGPPPSFAMQYGGAPGSFRGGSPAHRGFRRPQQHGYMPINAPYFQMSQNQGRFRRYDFNIPMPYHARGPSRYNRNNAGQKFDSDYDFEKANEEFVSGKISKLNINDGADKDKHENNGNDSAPLKSEANVDEMFTADNKRAEPFYDRSVSFFDRISCESLERQDAAVVASAVATTASADATNNETSSSANAGANSTSPKNSAGAEPAMSYKNRETATVAAYAKNPRAAWRHERELNQLTFGFAALAPRNSGYRRMPPLMAMQQWAPPQMAYHRGGFIPRGTMIGGRYR